MPYALPAKFNTKENNAKMERCVTKVMKQGHDKSSAIAICKSTIMGTRKKPKKTTKLDIILNEFEINREEVKKNKEINMTKKDIKKDDEVKVEEEVKEEEVKEEEKVEEVVEETPEAKPEEEKAEEAEAPAEEAEAESEEEKEEEKAEEGEEVHKELDPIAVLKSISEMSDPKEIKESIEAALSQLTKKDEDGKVKQASNVAVDVVKMLQAFGTKLDAIESLVKVDDKPEEPEEVEAEKGEDKPEGEAEEVSSEDAKPEDASDETPADAPKEEAGEDIVKVEGSIMAKVDEKLSPINEALKAIQASIKKLSEQPAPSKVKSSVVEKSFEVSEDNQKRVDEITKRLDEIGKVRDTNPNKYNSERLADEAFKLLNERERLTLGL